MVNLGGLPGEPGLDFLGFMLVMPLELWDSGAPEFPPTG